MWKQNLVMKEYELILCLFSFAGVVTSCGRPSQRCSNAKMIAHSIIRSWKKVRHLTDAAALMSDSSLSAAAIWWRNLEITYTLRYHSNTNSVNLWYACSYLHSTAKEEWKADCCSAKQSIALLQIIAIIHAAMKWWQDDKSRQPRARIGNHSRVTDEWESWLTAEQAAAGKCHNVNGCFLMCFSLIMHETPFTYIVLEMPK